MSASAPLSTVYCTDEDICVRCYADFATLVPKDQVMAQGTDGVFNAADPWTLNSPSVNFATQGVQVGHVVQLTTGQSGPFKGSGVKLAVAAVNANAVTLRRCGELSGVGQPPGPAAGASGVNFLVQTFGPQIEDVSFWLNQKFGIDPSWGLSDPKLIADLRVLRQATVLEVIVRAYAGDTRSKDGDFYAKLSRFKQSLSDTMAIVQVRWNQATNTPPPTSLFGLRASR